MTCVPGGPFEFLARPYPYKREPFQLASGELVAFEGIYFSLPASGLLLDKRLFTDDDAHPVDSTVRLYINRDAGLSSLVEPDDDGTVYSSGTPHYADYILDMRSLIFEVTALHAADTDYTAQQFLEDHLRRVRAPYDLSAYQVSPGEFLHPEPTNTVPSGASPPGTSGALQPPGDGFELGARSLMDLDMDEILWQAIARPKRRANATPQSVPVEPIFPVVLPGGSLPTFTSLEQTNLRQLALLGSTSGGLVVTGDGLVAGTSIKLSLGSGVTPAATGSFVQVVPWKLFPCGLELCTYYSPHGDPSATINALGRQGIYAAPGGLSEGVYLLAASANTQTSGLTVQHWPGNYHGISGIDQNGRSHNGVHVTSKLLYNLSAAGGTIAGHSPINGEKVFTRWVGTQAGSKGETFSSAGPKYANGQTVYAAGKVVNPAINNFTASTVNWATVGNNFSPVSWATLTTTALGPARGIFGVPNSVTYVTADVQAGTDRGVIRRKQYAQWGFIDQVVAPDQDRGQGGQRKFATINYHTIEYREGTNPITGEFAWIPVGESDTSRDISWFDNTYHVNNIFSFFFLKKPNNGLVHVNGDIYVQWSDKISFTDVLPRKNRFAPIGAPTTRLYPATARSDTVVSIGFFPSWKLVRYVTTNNQVSVPDTIALSPANSATISFDPSLDFDTSTIQDFGPPVWDPSAGINYIYFTAIIGSQTRIFFAHMDTSFVITRINRVDAGILSGRMVLLNV